MPTPVTKISEPLLELVLNVEPMPCPRPRVALRGRIPVAYYPAEYTKWKERVKALIASHLDSGVIVGTLAVSAIFVATKPKTSKLPAPRWDVDNAAKAVMDAMTAAGVWEDDAQVVRLEAEKRWGTEPRIYLRVASWPA